MTDRPVSCLLLCTLALGLALGAGCSSKARYTAANAGSNCYAKAMPSNGEGGLAFANTLAMARKKSMASCIRYAGRSGGTPDSCQVVLAQCKR
ncbi:hypothetical protein [Pseudomonas entomophila]|uniref:hypothetical protein n=1 Tax=Pseudomonas entomophila TaxID=312306 RepID=UPI00200CDE69|nr:hypothetical protein [Pseudomonas entomophila]